MKCDNMYPKCAPKIFSQQHHNLKNHCIKQVTLGECTIRWAFLTTIDVCHKIIHNSWNIYIYINFCQNY